VLFRVVSVPELGGDKELRAVGNEPLRNGTPDPITDLRGKKHHLR
jgi:hypothetical protein